ncbi:MAG: prolyl oligopeptidase family serine peptidase [Alistipes sp.]|nr:prolyl oligopeptidase family serine peptidase [Alistipes sp.]
MKRFILLLAAVALFAIPAIANSNDGNGTLTEHTFKHKGIEYTYWLYKPQNLPDGAPLIMAFHGYGSRNIPSVGYGFHPVADQHGFAVCYPKGPKDNKDRHCWAVGYDFHFEAGWERDDVGFAIRLVKHLQKKHGFSKHNVFATGHSNGGEMSYLLAYKASHIFAAVAPISGLTMEWMYRDLKAKRPIPVMEVHGTEDKTSKWNSNLHKVDKWGPYIAVPRAVGYWAAVNRCTHEETEELPVIRNKVVAHRYVGGINGNEVWLYEVIGGKHSWAEKDMNTAAEIWKFFSKYLK